MSSSDQQCSRAVAAAREVIQEACDGEGGEMVEIGDGAFAFIPDERRDEFDFDLDSPQTDREIERAIESCMGSEWSTEWADSTVGEDAPADVRETVMRRACEGLIE